MGQSRLSGISVLNVENRVARVVDHDNVINQFVTLKSGRTNF